MQTSSRRLFSWVVVLSFACAAILLPRSAQAQLTAPLTLVPKPASVVLTADAAAFHLDGSTRIVAVTGDRRAAGATRGVARFVHDWLQQDCGLNLKIEESKKGEADRAGIIVVTERHAEPSLGPEGYSLTVTDRQVVVRAPTEAGLFYGGETMRQLMPPRSAPAYAQLPFEAAIPALVINDTPRFPERSLMIDSARHFQTTVFIKRTVDLLAYHKLNTLHWHLTDDQGWRLQILKYPKLTEVGAYRDESGTRYGSFYTQDQVRDIVAYAAARHITIVPELDMPAHCLSLLASYPENACFPRALKVSTAGVAPGGEWSPDILCAGREETYAFVEDVLTEVMKLFPSTAIHIGGDECPTERWHACPVCQAKMKAEGLQDERALQNYFTRRIAVFLTKHNRRLQGWNEILEGGKLPTDVVIEPWNRPESAAIAARAGNTVVVASTRYAYFDYSDNTTPIRRTYSWNPMPDGLTPEQSTLIQGPEACLWTEGKKDDDAADRFVWPRTIALAEVGWTTAAQMDWTDFRARLERDHYARLAHMGLGAPASVGSPAATLTGLYERSVFDPGARIGLWAPAQMSETVVAHDWDATPFLAGPGAYRVRFDYESGLHAMAISEVDLVQIGANGTPDVVVAKDIHDGWAGNAAHDQTYRFDILTIDSTAHYALRVHLRSDGGTDSNGEIYISKVTMPTARVK